MGGKKETQTKKEELAARTIPQWSPGGGAAIAAAAERVPAAANAAGHVSAAAAAVAALVVELPQCLLPQCLLMLPAAAALRCPAASSCGPCSGNSGVHWQRLQRRQQHPVPPTPPPSASVPAPASKWEIPRVLQDFAAMCTYLFTRVFGSCAAQYQLEKLGSRQPKTFCGLIGVCSGVLHVPYEHSTKFSTVLVPTGTL